MTWVKICGLTNAADVATVVEQGVDAVGFIFAPSKRRVEPHKVKEILRQVPRGIEKIGVFMNQEAALVQQIAEFCGLTGLQFHGRESPAFCRSFRHYLVIKTFRVDQTQGWGEIAPYLEGDTVQRILLDTYIKGNPGGTGQVFPWHLVQERYVGGEVPLIIAGGLKPSNVRQVIKQINPFGIDVSSGVERQPGQKAAVKVQQLFANIKS